jgi:hypothetical protein
MSDYARDVRDILARNKCHFVRHGKGDHDIWYSPITSRNIAVDGKIVKRNSANKTLSQAGVPERP